MGSPGGDKWLRHKLVIFKLFECMIVVAISLAPKYIQIKREIIFILAYISVGVAFMIWTLSSAHKRVILRVIPCCQITRFDGIKLFLVLKKVMTYL